MTSFLIRRLLSTIPLLFVILLGSFVLMQKAPGGPFDSERSLPPEIEANLQAKYHLDEPVIQQFGRYLGNVVQGDLGPSLKYQARSVNEIIAQALPVSLTLGAIALFMAMALGIPAGILGALNHNGPKDFLLMGVALLGICIPNFVLGPLLIILVSFGFGWLPAGGWGTLGQVLLPAITLGAIRAAYVARLARAGMLEVVKQDYIRTARAKGLRERVVIGKHALRLAILPVLSYLGPATASILVGSVVVEKIFNIPGLGTFFVNSALNRDYTMAMGTVLLYSGLLITLNLIVDVLYAVIDPRVELS
ncbi:MAG: ABC transporter permease subunit [Candidatus Eisenbacteria bacterium]|uniref:ABC transporter permease subunit n=1 Tax=Eiseniibacteriota bacterium TaxID=2212470 RepID=A0A7Y2ECM7_UNCEI|nr:ABC transporter permease subunit [Candidatus Eisenbacteria bacterium]